MNLTPTEQKIYDVLSDGQPHRGIELHACLPDELGPIKNISPHLASIRFKLRPLGLGIAYDGQNGSLCYRLVRFISNR